MIKLNGRWIYPPPVFIYCIHIYTFFARKESTKETLGAELHSLNNCMVRPETVKLAFAQTMTVLSLSYLHCLLITLCTKPSFYLKLKISTNSTLNASAIFIKAFNPG